MKWPRETPGLIKFVYIISTILFLATWIGLLSWTSRNFHHLPSEARFQIICLLVIYPVPCIRGWVEYPRSSVMFGLTYIVLMFAVLTIKHL